MSLESQQLIDLLLHCVILLFLIGCSQIRFLVLTKIRFYLLGPYDGTFPVQLSDFRDRLADSADASLNEHLNVGVLFSNCLITNA